MSEVTGVAKDSEISIGPESHDAREVESPYPRKCQAQWRRRAASGWQMRPGTLALVSELGCATYLDKSDQEIKHGLALMKARDDAMVADWRLAPFADVHYVSQTQAVVDLVETGTTMKAAGTCAGSSWLDSIPSPKESCEKGGMTSSVNVAEIYQASCLLACSPLNACLPYDRLQKTCDFQPQVSILWQMS